MKKYLAAGLIINMVLIGFPLAALATEAPQIFAEAETFGITILERLPNTIKDLWYNQTLPLWRNMWIWTKGFWNSTLGSKVQKLWEKLWGLIGEETPDIKGEFQKEKEEMQKDLWERFKSLF